MSALAGSDLRADRSSKAAHRKTRSLRRDATLPSGFVINAGSGSGIAAASLQNIQNREEEHPNDVNEVPIQTCAVKKTVLPRSDFPCERPDQRSDEQDHTD
jgi:hypothetical protein